MSAPRVEVDQLSPHRRLRTAAVSLAGVALQLAVFGPASALESAAASEAALASPLSSVLDVLQARHARAIALSPKNVER
jgi:hypothetical protein